MRTAVRSVLTGLALAAALWWTAAPHAARAADVGVSAPAQVGTVAVGNRAVVTLHGTLLGSAPHERASLARSQIDRVVAANGPGVVTRTPVGDGVRFDVDGVVVFFLLPADVAGAASGMTLEVAAQEVQRRLEVALREAREMADPTQWLVGVAASAAATLVFAALLWGLLRFRRGATRRLSRAVDAWRARNADANAITTTWAEHFSGVPELALVGLVWIVGLALADGWITFVLRQFAFTRPWGERSTEWIVDQLSAFALAIVGAIPGLITAALIFLLARLVARAVSRLLVGVERGEVQVGWLDADTAGPTRRLGVAIIWLFAIAMAYPYLPGSGTEAFKGITVLAGLMLSLGASGVVGQALSGLSLMYSRSLRVGEYVRVGDTEGTVVSVGMLSTKLHTGMGEEVSLPSAVVFGQPVRNFSRLVQDGRFVLHTTVTIGYSTPWRQVHALLLESARRTPGVAENPPPYVVQTALSDFYVEYRLCAQATKTAPNRRIEAMNALHANIQDVFNEHGVQIMSPHYSVDPIEPQLVGPDAQRTAPDAGPTAPPLP